MNLQFLFFKWCEQLRMERTRQKKSCIMSLYIKKCFINFTRKKYKNKVFHNKSYEVCSDFAVIPKAVAEGQFCQRLGSSNMFF